jgi:hypothetical protein
MRKTTYPERLSRSYKEIWPQPLEACASQNSYQPSALSGQDKQCRG